MQDHISQHISIIVDLETCDPGRCLMPAKDVSSCTTLLVEHLRAVSCENRAGAHVMVSVQNIDEVTEFDDFMGRGSQATRFRKIEMAQIETYLYRQLSIIFDMGLTRDSKLEHKRDNVKENENAISEKIGRLCNAVEKKLEGMRLLHRQVPLGEKTVTKQLSKDRSVSTLDTILRASGYLTQRKLPLLVKPQKEVMGLSTSTSAVQNVIIYLAPWMLNRSKRETRPDGFRGNLNFMSGYEHTFSGQAQVPLDALARLFSLPIYSSRTGCFFVWCDPTCIGSKLADEFDVESRLLISGKSMSTSVILCESSKIEEAQTLSDMIRSDGLNVWRFEAMRDLVTLGSLVERIGREQDRLSTDAVDIAIRFPKIIAMILKKDFVSKTHVNLPHRKQHKSNAWAENILRAYAPNSFLIGLLNSKVSSEVEAHFNTQNTELKENYDTETESMRAALSTTNSPAYKSKSTWVPMSPLKMPGLSPRKTPTRSPFIASPSLYSPQSPSLNRGLTPKAGSSRRVDFLSKNDLSELEYQREILADIAESHTSLDSLQTFIWLAKSDFYPSAFGVGGLSALKLEVRRRGESAKLVKPLLPLACFFARIQRYCATGRISQGTEPSLSPLQNMYQMFAPGRLKQKISSITLPEPVSHILHSYQSSNSLNVMKALLRVDRLQALINSLPVELTNDRMKQKIECSLTYDFRAVAETQNSPLSTGLQKHLDSVRRLFLDPLVIIVNDLAGVYSSLHSVNYVHLLTKADGATENEKWSEASTRSMSTLVRFVRKEVIPGLEQIEVASAVNEGRSKPEIDSKGKIKMQVSETKDAGLNDEASLTPGLRACSLRLHLNLLFGDLTSPLISKLLATVLTSSIGLVNARELAPAFFLEHSDQAFRDPISPKSIAEAAGSLGLLLISLDSPSADDGANVVSSVKRLNKAQWLLLVLFGIYFDLGLPKTVKSLATAEPTVDWDTMLTLNREELPFVEEATQLFEKFSSNNRNERAINSSSEKSEAKKVKLSEHTASDKFKQTDSLHKPGSDRVSKSKSSDKHEKTKRRDENKLKNVVNRRALATVQSILVANSRSNASSVYHLRNPRKSAFISSARGVLNRDTETFHIASHSMGEGNEASNVTFSQINEAPIPFGEVHGQTIEQDNQTRYGETRKDEPRSPSRSTTNLNPALSPLRKAKERDPSVIVVAATPKKNMKPTPSNSTRKWQKKTLHQSDSESDFDVEAFMTTPPSPKLNKNLRTPEKRSGSRRILDFQNNTTGSPFSPRKPHEVSNLTTPSPARRSQRLLDARESVDKAGEAFEAALDNADKITAERTHVCVRQSKPIVHRAQPRSTRLESRLLKLQSQMGALLYTENDETHVVKDPFEE